jgi:hypothetical protein
VETPQLKLIKYEKSFWSIYIQSYYNVIVVKLLTTVAPQIGDLSEMQQTIVVKENENVRLKCTASGSPKPDITWRRDDNKAISLGSVTRKSLFHSFINFISNPTIN